MPKRTPKKSSKPAIRGAAGEILCPICARAPLLSKNVKNGTVMCPLRHVMTLSSVYQSIPTEYYSNN